MSTIREFAQDKIRSDLHQLAVSLSGKIVMTSGGFDPCHCGHARCIQDSTRLGEVLVVVVNGDNFLMRKKGFVFMPLEQRLEMIAAIEGVDFVVPWDDGTQFVHNAILTLKPHVFAKGGDRSSPLEVASCELAACQSVGCTVAYGVGGAVKVESSSRLVERAQARCQFKSCRNIPQ